MYAIVESGGKQYRVEKGDTLFVDRLPDERGAKVKLRPLLYRSDKTVFEAGELAKVTVEATIDEHVRGPKIKIFKYKAKKGYRRRAGHRSELTRLKIGEIKIGAAGAKAATKTEEKPDAAGTQPAGKKPATAKPAAAKKPAAKKPPARKPAADKKDEE